MQLLLQSQDLHIRLGDPSPHLHFVPIPVFNGDGWVVNRGCQDPLALFSEGLRSY